MTREEASEVIRAYKNRLTNSVSNQLDQDIEAFDVAIKALEQPCEDCISREDALMCLTGEWTEPTDELIHRFIRRIRNLPSVTPAEKVGHWIACSDRLPEAGEYVGDVAKYYLVQNEYGDMLVARYTRGEYWEQMYQLKPVDDKIVAWMPLSVPYKQEEVQDE